MARSNMVKELREMAKSDFRKFYKIKGGTWQLYCHVPQNCFLGYDRSCEMMTDIGYDR